MDMNKGSDGLVCRHKWMFYNGWVDDFRTAAVLLRPLQI